MLSGVVSPAVRRTLRCVGRLTLFALCLPIRLPAQCPGLCGDVNGSGTVNSADIISLARYTERAADTFVAQSGCADLDDYQGVTIRDLCALAGWHSLVGPAPDCELNNGPYAPKLNTEAFIHFNSIVPPGDSLVRLYVDATLPESTCGVALAVRVFVDGQVPEFGAINANVSEGYGWSSTEFGDQRTANVPPGYLMGGYADYTFHSVTPGRHPLGVADLIISPSSTYRTITLELTEWPPGDNTPMLVKRYPFNALELNMSPWIVDQAGDANNDRMLTAADIIALVNFVFKSGSAPYPVPATGDVNCSGTVTSSDVIGLVNYVFKSGMALCDVEAECTINFDQWTCP
jgi:hypothetical protein